jgi:hypothetical protein
MSIPTNAPSQQRKKRYLLIAARLLGLVAGLSLWLYVRGTWADPVTHNPATPAEGTVTQLYRTPQGDSQIGCAILVDAPAVNRGGWTVTAAGPRQALVVLSLQWETRGYPSFFLRNLLLDRLPKLRYSLRDEMCRREEMP